jgi:hypothetical protein
MSRNRAMTEAEWLTTTDPTSMLNFLREQQISERKMRLLACACCRRIWDHLTDPRSRRAVEVAERFADEQATPRELAYARNAALSVQGKESWAPYWATNTQASGPLVNVLEAAAEAKARTAAQLSTETHTWDRVQAETVREQVTLIHEIIGNPFLFPMLDATLLGWEDGLVVDFARGIYQDQAFERMPILGDALEEAGSTDERILEHCRHGGPHVRGCWVIDLILEKP